MIEPRKPFAGSDRKDRFLPSPQWQALRMKVMMRDEHLCQLKYPECTGQAQDVDHKDDNWENNSLGNLQAVCKACHNRKSGEHGRRNRTVQAPHEGHKKPGLIETQITLTKATKPSVEKAWIKTVGPMWDKDTSGDYILPKNTLGYHVILWGTQNLLHAGQTFKLSGEQARFILWYYQIDENGDWVNRVGIKIAPKGWGKDPLAAYMCAVEMVGPCRFGGWNEKGNPTAIDEKNASVQLAAVKMSQNGNTWEHLVDIFRPEAVQRYNIINNATVIYSYGGRRKIQQQSSAARGLEGTRPTFVLCNETHHWLRSNGCERLWKVLDRNSLKVPHSHILEITNMPNPAENSIAQQHMESYEDYIQGRAKNPKILLDYIGVTDDAPIQKPEDRLWIISQVYGTHGAWNPIKEYVDKFDDTTLDPAESIQFFMNGIGVDKSTWVDIRNYDACRIDIETIPLGSQIIMAGDGSKNDDSTGLTGMVVGGKYDKVVFKIGVWEKPSNSLMGSEPWTAPRDEVMQTIIETFNKYNVLSFRFDPSHKKDDGGESYWIPMLNDLHRKYSNKIHPQFWSSKNNAFIWDMASTAIQQEFVEALGVLAQEITDITMRHTDDSDLRRHFQNARRTRGVHGYSIGKASRQSPDKIDLAVCVGINYAAYLAYTANRYTNKSNLNLNTLQS
jgi:hypothetical protein